MSVPETGLRGSAVTVVSRENIAVTLGSGTLEVFATPIMIALMEKAAMESVQPCLEPGQGTVGVKLEVSHTAATPMGVEVRAESELVTVEGRRLTFKVAAYAAGELIGEGIHQRCIIQNDRFMAKTLAKAK